MDLVQESLYIGALYVGFGLSLGLMAQFVLFFNFSKIKKNFFPLTQKEIPWFLVDGVVVFLIYFGFQLLFGAFSLLLGKLDLVSDPFLHYLSLFWATIGVNVLILLFVLAYFQRKYKLDWEVLGFYRKRVASHIGLGLLTYLAFVPVFFGLIFLSAIVCSLFGIEPKPHVLIDILKKEDSLFVLGGLAVFASIIGPIVEEILFRGILFPAVKKKWGTRVGLISTSLFFALIHFNLFQFIPIFGLGLILTFLYEKTGNLVPSITLHAMNNTVSVVLTFTLLNSAQ